MYLFLVLTKIEYFMYFMTIFSKYWFINIKVWILFIEVKNKRAKIWKNNSKLILSWMSLYEGFKTTVLYYYDLLI